PSAFAWRLIADAAIACVPAPMVSDDHYRWGGCDGSRGGHGEHEVHNEETKTTKTNGGRCSPLRSTGSIRFKLPGSLRSSPFASFLRCELRSLRPLLGQDSPHFARWRST